MIDEIDKMGADFRGDPSSAMLEVLDPEQNSNFRDHYLDLPFDLSRVMFITTANQLEPIPPALRDRMERSSSPATEEEKLEIAKRYLVARQIERNGLDPEKIEFTEEALGEIAEGYARGQACATSSGRSARCAGRSRFARRRGGARRRVIRRKQVRDLLGRRRFLAEVEVRRRTSAPRWPRAWPGLRPAARSCSWRRPRSPAREGSRSPAR